MYRQLLLLIFFAAFISSCRKDLITTNPADKLTFSTDTLTFDTVFTSLGSTTQYFTVHNTSNNKIVVSDIKLGDANAATWRLNIDGRQVNEATDVEIPAHDSIYIFVAVTVDPSDENNPYVLYDSVLFETNGNTQKVILQAWGQNAHFFYGQVIETQEWVNDKPYVIIGNSYLSGILVDSNATLTIDAGCRIFMHANSRFYVYGTLKVMGQLHDSVQFRGDRLEQYFIDLPGNWEGIHLLRSSHDNEINYAVIKEAQVGIRIDSLKESAAPKLTLRNTVIKYTLSSGILAITADVYGENCLVFNCGDWDLQLEYGGNYNFQNCTFADYSNTLINHQSPVVRMSNYFFYKDDLGDHYLNADLNSTFTNCIVYGSLENELERAERDQSAFNYVFDHCDMKLADTVITDNAHFLSVIRGAGSDPQFVDAFSKDDYHLPATSPCINAGITNGIIIDLEGNPRIDNPDIGCYEFH